MRRRALPYFDAMQNSYLFRVYVTSADLLCVQLGRGPVPKTPSPLATRWGLVFGFLVGIVINLIVCVVLLALSWLAGVTLRAGPGGFSVGMAIFQSITCVLGVLIPKIREVLTKDRAIDVVGRFEKGVEEDLIRLDKYDEDGIRDYITEKKRGYVLRPEKLESARIDFIDTWKQIFLGFLGEKSPAFIAQHPVKGRCMFVFRKKLDIATGLYELQQLLGDALEVDDGMDVYDKAMKKYAQTKSSA